MSENRSDYSLPRVDVNALLPVVVQNPLLKAVSEATFNRFLTQPELARVIGTIGIQTPNAKDTLIVEQNVYDQAYQLQPAIIDNTKSTTNIISYADIQRIAERLGIDFTNPALWQDTEQFNFCPPIDLDKLINYRDYYWVDGNMDPQYITIANRRIRIQAALSQMVANYLIQITNADKMALWPIIEHQMNLVHTVVPTEEQLTIPNIQLVAEDAQHPVYVAKILTDVQLSDYTPKNDWSKQNAWVHRNDLDDLSSAIVATLPIIEYKDTIVLTSWTYTKHLWEYRQSPAFAWEMDDNGPTKNELFNHPTRTSHGDDWLGFEQHWKYLGAQPPVPVTAQTTNNAGSVALAVAHANQTVFTTNDTIMLGDNILRVYVNGVRQYGTYEETNEHTVTFYEPLGQGAIVQLMTDVAAVSDLGLESVTAASISLVEYRLEEQYKHHENDYPQFDLVDANGKSLHESSSIFSFAEDPSYPVNAILGKRIEYSALTRDYGFNIGLVSADKQFKFYVDSVDGVSSVWAKDTTGAKYVPQKVDSKRRPSTAADAVWEIPGPFMNNVAHECRNHLNFSEMFVHFASIVDAQTLSTTEKGYYGQSNNKSYRLNSNLNLGAGGTIKEYNGNFANFISALISSDYSPLDIIDFAQEQYETQLITIRKTVESNMIDVLLDKSIVVQQDIVGTLTALAIQGMQYDATLSKLYNDSSVSLAASLKNWIATLPYIRMARPVAPKLLRDDKIGMMRLTHHDGHVTASEIVDETNLRNAIIASVDSTDAAPTSPKLGSIWYKASTDTLSRFDGTNWVLLDQQALILSVIMNIESILFDNAPNVAPKYDIAALRNKQALAFDNLLRIEFETYCKAKSITSPYTGDFDITNPFTWNYAGVDVRGDNGSGTVIIGAGGGNRVTGVNIPASQKLVDSWATRWEDIYMNFYGTMTPHLEPWILQGYDAKPDYWDAMYKGTGRRWTFDMWLNICQGIVPIGKKKASGATSDGNRDSSIATPVTSVNITNRTIGGYGPDDLLPPYWPYTTQDGNYPTILNQGMLDAGFDYQSAHVSTNTYKFGENGIKERTWRQSIGFIYAEMKIAFKLDPIRFLNATFGEDLIKVQGLEICDRTDNVLSHHDVLFHGDIDNAGNKVYFAGMNQWYVQFFRYASLYGNGGSAQRVWKEWNPQLSYNVGGFMVDNTLSITSARIDIAPTDFSVQLKAAKKVRDLWIDALYVTVNQPGSFNELPRGPGRDWKFNVGVRNPVVRDIEYYGVKKYKVTADATNNTFTFDGNMTLEKAGWTTGVSIMLDTGVNGLLPNAVDDVTYYTIIPKPFAGGGTTGQTSSGTSRFALANSKAEATAGTSIPLLTDGSGVFYVAELLSTFYAIEAANTDTLWKHYVIDTSDLRTFSSTTVQVGVQNVVDFVDGYVARLSEYGFDFNDSSVPEYDANNRLINWQYELESMIDYLYLSMGTIAKQSGVSIPQQIGEVEMSPFRNNLWINHPTGVVSEFNNVLNSSSQAFVYDRSGAKLSIRDFHVLRQDNRTQFTTLSTNDPTIQTNDVAFNYDPNIAIAGMHLFFDEYEHVVLFNPRTIARDYLFDSFLSISVPRLQAYFERQAVATKRANVGGFVLQGNSLSQNYEYTVGNIQKYYDTFTVNENANFVNNARALLGYKPNASYFQGTQVTPKSQFLFYKGMIKAKGTLASVKAFTNSTQGATSEIDEFWAYKAFEFGDKRTKVAYTMNMKVTDTALNTTKLQFVPTPTSTAASDFVKVAVSDSTRWFNFPSQLGYLATINKLFGMQPFGVQSADGSIIPVVSKVPYTRFRPIVGSINIDGVVANRKLLVHGQATGITLFVSAVTGLKRVTIKTNSVDAIYGMGTFKYVPGTNNIDVYVNGVRTTEFVETSPTQITLNTPVNGVVVVVKKIGTLTEGTHYLRRNSRTVELLIDIDTGDIQIVTYKADYSECTPVKVYDQKSNAVIADIPAWDPQSGFDDAALVQNIDISNVADVAHYNKNPETAKVDLFTYWGPNEIGTTWKDLGSYQYAPYDEVTLASNKQLAEWGGVAEWSDPAVYQWVESTVLPMNWDTTNGTPRSEVYTRTRTLWDITDITVASGQMVLHGSGSLEVGDEVVLFGTTLPAPLLPETIYNVKTAAGLVITVCDRDGTPIVITDAGSDDLQIAKASYDAPWVKIAPQLENHEMLEANFATSTIVSRLPANSEVTVYANGKYMQDGVIEAVPNSINNQFPFDADVLAPYVGTAHLYQITIITKTGVVDGLATTIPDDLDLTNTDSQTYTTMPYTSIDRIATEGILPEPKYYFWVRGLIAGNKKQISMAYAEYLIANNDSPYLTCMHPVDIEGAKCMDQLVITGISGTVTDDDRYVLRMSKNSTLRDSVTNAAGQQLNNVHSQWVMFREGQANNVSRALWDKVTESIVGYTLADPSNIVPSLDRVIYDAQHGTNTRYGLNKDQVFVDGEQALATLKAYLNSATIVYEDVDIDSFLTRFNFSTVPNTVEIMNEIFLTFPAKFVNMLFFAVLNDALSNHKVDYSKSLMKTSMVSLSGSTVLNVNGMQDE